MPDGAEPGSSRSPRIVVIGAGVSGICAAIRLDEAGFRNFTVLEKADRPGGTWRDNTYPGAACDVPAHLYSFSFAPNKCWSRKFAGQAEILAYLERCAAGFGVMDRIRLGAAVVEAAFDDARGGWRVRLDGGEVIEADILISATGQLHHPRYPDIPGRDSFAGPGFHSARWRHDVDLAGRSVAIVGAAASAVQIAPRIRPVVGKLTIFQRSPNWIAPLPDRPYPAWLRWLWGAVPPSRILYRWYLYLGHEMLIAAFRSGGPANRLLRAALTLKMRRKIPDERQRRSLIPDYPPGCKRILRGPAYLRLLSDPAVTVVADEIERIVPDGLVTRNGALHEADAIVYATGFIAPAFVAPIEIRGRGGTGLNEAWRRGPEAYLGMTVPGFPNFFMLYGPNTNLGHNSVIFMIERQCNYVVRMLKHLSACRAGRCEVRPEALERHREKLAARFGDTVWTAGCRSYYTTEGRRVVSIWPFSTVRYWLETRRPRLRDYVIGG